MLNQDCVPGVVQKSFRFAKDSAIRAAAQQNSKLKNKHRFKALAK